MSAPDLANQIRNHLARHEDVQAVVDSTWDHCNRVVVIWAGKAFTVEVDEL